LGERRPQIKDGMPTLRKPCLEGLQEILSLYSALFLFIQGDEDAESGPGYKKISGSLYYIPDAPRKYQNVS
jgi:hypothetical protein